MGFSREKSQNLRENRPISRDIRGRKSKFTEKLADFTGFSAKESNFEGFSGASS